MFVDNLKLLVLYRVMEGKTGRELREEGLDIEDKEGFDGKDKDELEKEGTKANMSYDGLAKERGEAMPYIEEEQPIEDEFVEQPPLQLHY